jgi:hypothetical protein
MMSCGPDIGVSAMLPEMRENHGEIEAALEGRLPQLITLANIKGDLHAHTTKTAGRATLEEMVEGARAKDTIISRSPITASAWPWGAAWTRSGWRGRSGRSIA